ncbi:MAG: hypothetical protein IPM50_06110 [Acidobacteriota bacterium]|nr:MAG: hypothetical protein IPM50_06110 [Acidobacteriota bacterium]
MNSTDNIIALKARPTPNPISAATPVPAAQVTPAPVTPPASEQPKVIGFSQQPFGGEGYTGPDSSYRLCAKEGEPCKYIGQVSIAYGVGEQFSVKEFTVKKEETRICNEASFGDPAPRLPKRCYVKQIKPVVIEHAAPNPDYTFCVDAPYRCNFSYVGTVAFGVNGFFNYKTGLIRGVDCNVDVFGDPAPGVPEKKCYVKFEKPWVPNNTPMETDNEGPPSADFRVCAAEGQNCRFTGTGTVAFGYNAKGGFRYKYGVKGSIPCDQKTFGDISPGKPKACYVRIE